MADVDVAIGIGRAIVEDELFAARAGRRGAGHRRPSACHFARMRRLLFGQAGLHGEIGLRQEDGGAIIGEGHDEPASRGRAPAFLPLSPCGRGRLARQRGGVRGAGARSPLTPGRACAVSRPLPQGEREVRGPPLPPPHPLQSALSAPPAHRSFISGRRYATSSTSMHLAVQIALPVHASRFRAARPAVRSSGGCRDWRRHRRACRRAARTSTA